MYLKKCYIRLTKINKGKKHQMWCINISLKYVRSVSINIYTIYILLFSIPTFNIYPIYSITELKKNINNKYAIIYC
jgi:hypothetical protein